MPTSPVVEWRASTTPFAVVSSVALAGSAFSGAIPVGTTSTPVTLRIYNNFTGAAGVVDALSCVIAAYDDTIHEGQATSVPSSKQYLQVKVTDYNGVTTGADATFFAIGGAVKHPLPVNGGTLGGASTNFATVILQAAIPATAVQGAVSQGLWLEYSSTV